MRFSRTHLVPALAITAGFMALGAYACGGDRITEPIDTTPRDTTPPTIIHANLSPIFGMPPLEVTAQMLCEDDGGIRNYILIYDLDVTTLPKYTTLPIDTTLTFTRSGDPQLRCIDNSGNSSSVYSERVEIIARDFKGQIAFSRLDNIWVVNEDGSGLEQLTNGTEDVDPNFSSDGKYLTYSTNMNGNWEIIIMDMDDRSLFRLTEDIQLTEGIEDYTQPGFSHNGEQIIFAYVENPSNIRGGIGSIDVDGTNFTSVVLEDPGDKPGSPNWSPNGNRIVFHSNRSELGWEIYTGNNDRTQQRNITTTIKEVYDAFPDWSFEETEKARIVWISDPNRLDGLYEAEIHTMMPDGSDILQLTDNLARENYPHWILNGTKILYSKLEPPSMENPSPTYNLWVIDSDGENEKKILDSPENDITPTWRYR